MPARDLFLPARARVLAVVGGLCLAALSMTACSAGSSGGPIDSASKRSSTSAGTGDPAAGTDGAARSLTGAPAGAPKAAAGSARNRVTLGPTRILTADLTVEVRPASVDSTADRATSLVVAAGGDLAGDQRTHEAGAAQADLVLKVPPARYPALLDQLGRLGTERSRSAQEQDVTDQVVDVDTRVATQQASVTRLTRLLAGAKNLGDIVTIEGELTRRQADLESLQARQRVLDAQTATATISLHLRGKGAAAPSPAKKRDGFAGGLAAGWAAFTAAGALLLTALGALLPFAALGALLFAGAVGIRRRRRHYAAGSAAPAA